MKSSIEWAKETTYSFDIARQSLFCRKLKSLESTSDEKTHVVFIHDLFDHSARYDDFFKYLFEQVDK